MMSVTETQQLEKALESFLESEDFAEAVISSTNAGFAGSGYSLELFHDGTYRTLWSDAIGNRYQPSGVILGVPGLSDEDYRDLCEVAGSDTSDVNLARELEQWQEFLMATAEEMRTALDEHFTVAGM